MAKKSLHYDDLKEGDILFVYWPITKTRAIITITLLYKDTRDANVRVIASNKDWPSTGRHYLLQEKELRKCRKPTKEELTALRL